MNKKAMQGMGCNATQRTRAILVSIAIVSGFAVSGCISHSTTASDRMTTDVSRLSYRDIDPASWIDTPDNRAVDPYQIPIQGLRDRKAKDLVNPEAPSAFAKEMRARKEYRAVGVPWSTFEETIALNWSVIGEESPDRLAALRRAFRLRSVLDHPDLRVLELVLAPGAKVPLHALADPSMLHVVGGRARVTVDDQVIEASIGASIMIEPMAPRAIEAISNQPFRALWFRWAPGGDTRYLDFGYYLTGANFHLQPIEATFPENYEHWEDDVRTSSSRQQSDSLTSTPSNSALYPTTAVLSNELDVDWLDFTKLADSGFFWAKDAQGAGHLLDRWDEIARMKGVFRAVRQDGRYDINLSYIAIGPTGKYITHSHATPEFYYILEGETEWILDGEVFTARPGNFYFHAPYWDHEMRGLVEGRPMRAITGSWAPFGDRSVWTKPGKLLESLPVQPDDSIVPEGFDFHDFPTKPLVFESSR